MITSTKKNTGRSPFAIWPTWRWSLAYLQAEICAGLKCQTSKSHDRDDTHDTILTTRDSRGDEDPSEQSDRGSPDSEDSESGRFVHRGPKQQGSGHFSCKVATIELNCCSICLFATSFHRFKRQNIVCVCVGVGAEAAAIHDRQSGAVAGGSRKSLQSAAATKTPDFSFPAGLELEVGGAKMD